ncbi:helix-turn-helix domain-containing protein [Nocardiopsis sp. NPDC007018]|uniref:winged helix-turn-helix domain-containing protein n=1 Tax=Nocardiopsis sp. NPDC007018 TaxID=3155721 RepID=UPI00341153AF
MNDEENADGAYTAPTSMEVGADALRGLAHPLRARILDELTAQGAATATILAGLLGESSGSTSYHLRQLARFGFVEIDPEHTGRRDRWWRPRRGGWHMSGVGHLANPATREAAEIVLDRYYDGRRERLERWRNRVRTRPDDPQVLRWKEAMQDSLAHLRMTPEETEEFAKELQDLIQTWSSRFDGRSAASHPDTEAVELHTDLFPHLADPPAATGEGTPGGGPAGDRPGQA